MGASSTHSSDPNSLMRVSHVLRNLSQEIKKASHDPVFMGNTDAIRYSETAVDHDAIQARLLKAEKLFNMRRRWERVFGNDSDLLHDPAMDILLYLLIGVHRHSEISVSAACYAVNAPQTTGLRYITKLCDRALVMRMEDPFDGRRHLLQLTEAGEQLINQCLEYA